MNAKQVAFTDEALEFARTLDGLSRKKLAKAVRLLQAQGFLRSPLGEKVDGADGLFAIRITTDENARLFYCYDDGTTIYMLSGYTKKTDKIPRRELDHAIEIKKGLGR